ncbi:MAG: efflux RND transporter periplasmic adaptor subunit [Halieaceae bacterium]
MKNVGPAATAKLAFALGLALMLQACSEPPVPPTEVIRSVRTTVVSEPASGKLRRYSGVVEAASTSNLSFEVPGNVQEVLVEVGESIRQGQVLARLDPSDLSLNVEAVQANVGQAEALSSDAEREYARLQSFAARDPGFVSQQALDQARVSVQAAAQGLSYARSRLRLAERDLQRAELLAPFDGVITDRSVDPFQEVSRGQKMFAVHIEGAMEAAVNIPESEIKLVYLGLKGGLHFPALPGESSQGLVTEISSAAGAANAFPIRLTIKGSDARIRPGLTTEVSLLLGDNEQSSAYLVPLSALGFGAGSDGDFVYVYDPDVSAVRKTLVQHSGIRGDNIMIEQGLDAGDIVVTAGVSFLQDGQQVRLMEQ